MCVFIDIVVFFVIGSVVGEVFERDVVFGFFVVGERGFSCVFSVFVKRGIISVLFMIFSMFMKGYIVCMFMVFFRVGDRRLIFVRVVGVYG